MTTGVSIEQYQERYNFTIEHGAVTDDELADLRHASKYEPIKIRRKIYSASLKFHETLYALRAEQIHFHWVWHNGVEVLEVAEGTFAGGVDRRITFRNSPAPVVLEWDQMVTRPRRGDVWLSLYIGEMPEWVHRKFSVAEKSNVFDHIAVISKDKRLFDMQRAPEPIVRLSPLLIGWKSGKAYLLAAWGLEHELPKSLGGLLDD